MQSLCLTESQHSVEINLRPVDREYLDRVQHIHPTRLTGRSLPVFLRLNAMYSLQES